MFDGICECYDKLPESEWSVTLRVENYFMAHNHGKRMCCECKEQVRPERHYKHERITLKHWNGSEKKRTYRTCMTCTQIAEDIFPDLITRGHLRAYISICLGFDYLSEG
jgi:hypothetical protein